MKPVYILVAVVVLALGASVFYANQAKQKANEGVTVDTHIRGNPDAPNTLKVYSDFECPACGQFYSVEKEVMDKYGDQIRLEYHHFPLITVHKYAVDAAIAAEAAGQQGKFWEMHDKLFENQSTWSKSTNPEAYFVDYATELDLNVAQFKRQLSSSVLKDAVMEGFNEARDLGLTGTPSLYLNGEKLNISTYDDFTKAIEEVVN